MIAVIQCAASKSEDAGFFRAGDGRRVCFVADPALAAKTEDVVYARPDDPSDQGPSWRELVWQYNQPGHGNPFGLARAGALYRQPIYRQLEARIGPDRLYILSAGWGLIAADFLTPQYDITFSAQADPCKRRRKRDQYKDFRMLTEVAEPILFFGGKDYLPLFVSLTAGICAPRAVFYRAADAPEPEGCTAIRFDTTRRTNWHYECAQAFLDGRLSLP